MMLSLKPRLLLLDEPTAGMAAADRQAAVTLIDRIVRETGATLLLTEHDMDVVFNLGTRISVLHYGEIVASGTPDEVRADPFVREIYLGRGGACLRSAPSTPSTATAISSTASGSRSGPGRGCPPRTQRRRQVHLAEGASRGRPARRRDRLRGPALGALLTHQRARLGLALVPEDRRIFPRHGRREPVPRRATPVRGEPRRVRRTKADLFSPSKPIRTSGDRLSGGQQQMVAVGRGLVPRPKLLMLDEPAEEPRTAHRGGSRPRDRQGSPDGEPRSW